MKTSHRDAQNLLSVTNNMVSPSINKIITIKQLHTIINT